MGEPTKLEKKFKSIPWHARWGFAPFYWVDEGNMLPKLHGVAHRDVYRARVLTTYMGLNLVVSLFIYVYFGIQFGWIPLSRRYLLRAQRKVCPYCGEPSKQKW